MKKQFARILLIFSVLLLAGAGCNKTSVQPANQAANQSIQYQGQQGKSALFLLKSKYQVETKSYGFGEMVESINGVKADKENFWEFRVNGQPSQVGAADYITKDTDKIEWKLQKTNPNL